MYTYLFREERSQFVGMIRGGGGGVPVEEGDPTTPRRRYLRPFRG